MSNSMQREPIFWTSTAPGYNDNDRKRTTMVKGRPVVERVPQHGHSGDYDDKRKAAGTRYVTVIRHDGHVVSHCLTSAAAHLNPNDDVGQMARAKMRHFGWYLPGQCPVALLRTGELRKGHIVDESLLKEQPCEHGTYSAKEPCKHSLSELAARRLQHEEIDRERSASHQDPAAKLVEAQREQTAVIASAVTAFMGSKPTEAPKVEPAKPVEGGKK